MGSGFSKMKKQARLLENQMAQMKEQIQAKEITVSSPGNFVTVTINGAKELKKISISPECVNKDDVEGLQDLIQSSLEAAYAKADEDSGSLPFPLL